MISFKHYLRLRPEQYCIEVKRGIMDWFIYIVNNISRKLNITSELLTRLLFVNFCLSVRFVCCCRFVRCCWNHRESRQSVCVTDFYSIVNVLYLPFASSIAIYCWTCILVNVKYIALPHLRYIVALFTRKSDFERFGRILSWPFTVPLR